MVPGLLSALEYDPFPPPLDYIKGQIKSQHWLVMLGMVEDQPKAFSIFELGIGHSQDFLGIHYAWVSVDAPGNLRSWLLEQLVEIAKSQLCDYITFLSTRKGWSKMFEPVAISFIRRIDR